MKGTVLPSKFRLKGAASSRESSSDDGRSTMGPESHMTVAVRIRPLSRKELESGIKSCCSVANDNMVVIKKVGDVHGYLKSQQACVNEYIFDAAFDDRSSQYEVYERTTKPYIPNILLGMNVTVFAYGATGAGKTHTMLGNTRADEASHHSDLGIIPNAVKDLFELLRQKASSNQIKAFDVIATYIEVYNEQVYDLLESSGPPLSIREDPEKGVVVVAGATEQPVTNFEEVMALLLYGNRNRKTEATQMNQVSSRSHAVFQLCVRQTKRPTASGKVSVLESKLSLIDLAGSERASATNNRGIRLKEGANINKSLLALANCINALAENSNSNKKGNVKYRDSKLTHLLRSSLEGNCSLVMIANVNPADSTYEDSHNTLKYANRAKNIKVNPTAKESLAKGSFAEREAALREENELLRARVRELEECIVDLQSQHNVELEQCRQSQEIGAMPQKQKQQQSKKYSPAKSILAHAAVLDVPLGNDDDAFNDTFNDDALNNSDRIQDLVTSGHEDEDEELRQVFDECYDAKQPHKVASTKGRSPSIDGSSAANNKKYTNSTQHSAHLQQSQQVSGSTSSGRGRSNTQSSVHSNHSAAAIVQRGGRESSLSKRLSPAGLPDRGEDLEPTVDGDDVKAQSRKVKARSRSPVTTVSTAAATAKTSQVSPKTAAMRRGGQPVQQQQQAKQKPQETTDKENSNKGSQQSNNKGFAKASTASTGVAPIKQELEPSLPTHHKSSIDLSEVLLEVDAQAPSQPQQQVTMVDSGKPSQSPVLSVAGTKRSPLFEGIRNRVLGRK